VDILPRSPSQPERRYDEERPRYTSQWQATHFLVRGPWALEALGARENRVPGEVHCSGYDGAHADGEEGETGFAAIEVVDACEDYGVGLQVDVEYGVCGESVSSYTLGLGLGTTKRDLHAKLRYKQVKSTKGSKHSMRSGLVKTTVATWLKSVFSSSIGATMVSSPVSLRSL
jgi:hypothetical protein